MRAPARQASRVCGAAPPRGEHTRPATRELSELLLAELLAERVDALVQLPPLVRDLTLALACRVRPEPEVDLILQAAPLGLANVFGQRPTTVRADVAAATMSLYAPTAVRGGLLWEARFHISAKRDLKNAILKLDPGWAEGMSMNTVAPSPVDEKSDNGRLSFSLGHIAAGHSFLLFLQF